MMDCSFTASSRTASSTTAIADSLNASTVKSMITLSKSAVTLRNAASVLLQNIVIMTACSKTVSLHIAVSTVISSIQLDSSNAEFTNNS